MTKEPMCNNLLLQGERAWSREVRFLFSRTYLVSADWHCVALLDLFLLCIHAGHVFLFYFDPNIYNWNETVSKMLTSDEMYITTWKMNFNRTVINCDSVQPAIPNQHSVLDCCLLQVLNVYICVEYETYLNAYVTAIGLIVMLKLVDIIYNSLLSSWRYVTVTFAIMFYQKLSI